jgi:hypothetical protein
VVIITVISELFSIFDSIFVESLCEAFHLRGAERLDKGIGDVHFEVCLGQTDDGDFFSTRFLVYFLKADPSIAIIRRYTRGWMVRISQLILTDEDVQGLITVRLHVAEDRPLFLELFSGRIQLPFENSLSENDILMLSFNHFQ